MNMSASAALVIGISDIGISGKARAANDLAKSRCASNVPGNQEIPEEEEKSAPASSTTLSIVKNIISDENNSLLC